MPAVYSQRFDEQDPSIPLELRQLLLSFVVYAEKRGMERTLITQYEHSVPLAGLAIKHHTSWLKVLEPP